MIEVSTSYLRNTFEILLILLLDISRDPENAFVRAIKSGGTICAVSKNVCIGFITVMTFQVLMSYIFDGISNGFENMDASHLYIPYSFVYVEEIEIIVLCLKICFSC